MARPIAWGIAGFGWVASDYMAPAIRAAGDRLVAVADPSPQARAAAEALGARAVADVEELAGVAEIEAVYVATPNHRHRSAAEAAAARGKAVLCEKPIAATLADAQAIVTACERAGVLYATAFDQRFHAAHRYLASLIADGALGRITAIRIVYACWVGADWAADNWRIDRARAGGGALIDLAPHGLDLAAMLLGEALCDIAALGQARVHEYPDRSVEDGAMVIARSRSGVLVQLHVAYNCPETLPRRRLEVLGTRGQALAVDTMGQTAGGTLTLTDAATGATRVETVPDAERSPFQAQVEAFADSVLGGTPYPFTGEADLALMRLVEAAQHAARPCLADAA